MNTQPTQPSREQIIEVKNLTKRYGDFTAVDNISFTIDRGEIFGILGPNGAGKTTTLEMMEGLKPITLGTVVLDGHDVARNIRLVKSLIGVQLQASSFFDGLNLRELLVTFASMYGRSVDPDQLLRQVQLTEKAGNQVKELSGGQKQRLSIAVALVNDPKVVFLDEPTTGLDPQARRNLWDLVTDINGRGKTVVLTTHYMDEAEVLCDRIAVMDHAKIVALNSIERLIKDTGLVSTVSFRAHKGPEPERLSGLPGVRGATGTEGEYRLISSKPQDTLTSLFEQAQQQKFQVVDLQVKNPTLEDVFIHLTGHELRD